MPMKELRLETGQKFNKLTVVKEVFKDRKSGSIFYLFLCDCGKEKILRGSHVNSSNTKSCGCLKTKSKRKINITGQKFGLLYVIKELNKVSGHSYWLCKCDCGTEIAVQQCRLTSGKKKYCEYRKHIDNNNIRQSIYEEIPVRHWNRTIRAAKKRQLEFSITIEYAWNLFIKQDRKCALTGIELYFSNSSFNIKDKQTASLDRIDSSKGYTEDNVQWVHKDVNLIKMDMDNNKFKKLCCQVAEQCGYIKNILEG